MLKVRNCGVRCGVVLSSMVRQGVSWLGIVLRSWAKNGEPRHGLSWRGRVRSGRAQYGEVLHSKVRYGSIRRGLAWLRIVRSCPVRSRDVRQGFITVLRGLSLHGTVRSCPVRLRKAWLFEVWHGMAVLGPVRLGHVLFGSARLGTVRCFMVRPGCAGWATAERGFVLYGKVRFYHGMVWRCPVWCCGEGGVLHSMVRFYYGMVWRCPVWLCGVQWGTVLHGKVLLWHGLEGRCGEKRGSAQHGSAELGVTWYGDVLRCGVLLGLSWLGKLLCGMVWSVEALHGIAKFCPVKHCMASLGVIRQAKASLRSGIARHGTAESGFARLRAVGQALASGQVLSCGVWRSPLRQSGVMYG